MTNEEAQIVIGNIPLHPEVLDDCYSITEYQEAKAMAIEALEKEPCEDCISRQAVDILVDELARVISDERCCISRGRSTATIMQDILDLPPVTPQPKVGRWILQPSNKEQGERDFIWWKCSECGQVIFSETEQDREEFHAYCSRCGAKMKEVEE